MESQETAVEYDFWTACWVLTSALGRSVIVDRPRAPVYLNWFLILAAESGTTRKSTAVRIASKLLANVLNEESYMITTKTSPEGLEETMHQLTRKYGHACVIVSISELITFLGKEKYNQSMPGLLTDLYDCSSLRASSGTIGRGEKVIKDIYMSFLSASTPSWLLRAINPDVIEGGFTSRTLFIVSEHSKRNIPWPEENQLVTENDLVRQLVDIKDKQLPTIQISEGALRKFSLWYKNRERHRDPFRASFESREDAHVLRLGATLSINDGSWEIQHKHITNSISIIQAIKAGGSSLFEGSSTDNAIILGIDKVRERLVFAGLEGIGHRDLFVKVRHYLSNNDFRLLIEIMHECEMVQVFETPNGKQKIYRGTKLLMKPGTLDELVSKFTE